MHLLSHYRDFLITSYGQRILHSWMGDVQSIVLHGLRSVQNSGSVGIETNRLWEMCKFCYWLLHYVHHCHDVLDTMFSDEAWFSSKWICKHKIFVFGLPHIHMSTQKARSSCKNRSAVCHITKTCFWTTRLWIDRNLKGLPRFNYAVHAW